MFFAQKRANLRGPESENRDSNALTSISRRSTTSNFRSSIKVLATKLDWLPASETQRVSLLSPVGPITHMRAVCKWVKPGEAISNLPAVVCAVYPVGVVTAPAPLHIALWCAPLHHVHKALPRLLQTFALWPRFKQKAAMCWSELLSAFAYLRHFLTFLGPVTLWFTKHTERVPSVSLLSPWHRLFSVDMKGRCWVDVARMNQCLSAYFCAMSAPSTFSLRNSISYKMSPCERPCRLTCTLDRWQISGGKASSIFGISTLP